MKKNFFAFAAALLLIMSLSGAAFAEYAGTSLIYVSVAKYEPFPAEAGQYVDIWFKIENVGSGTSNNVTLELLPKFPFSLESDDAVKSVGPVASGSEAIVKYHVKVDERATSGDNVIRLRYLPASVSGWVEKDIDIFIQAHDAVLSVSGMSSEEMVPGKVQALSISLENLANAYLKDIGVSLDFSGTALPFAPIDSVNEKRLPSIPAGGKAEISFDIITSPDAPSGVYKVPLTLRYSDITNKNYTRQYLVGFVVNSPPDFEISMQKYDIITEGASGTATVSVSNTGPGAIKFMTMEILPFPAYEIIGERTIYLGNLNPDDYQTGAFKVYVNKGFPGPGKKTIPIGLSFKYRDGLNNIYSKNATLDMRVYSPSEVSAYGLAPQGSSTMIYAAIAVIVIYYIYRKYFRKKPKA